jgi:hypothetical protein
MSRYQFIEQFFDHDSCRLLPVAEPDSATDGQTRSLQPTLPFCAMPSAMAPGAYGLNCRCAGHAVERYALRT